MTRKRYSLNSEDRIRYAGILLLQYMAKQKNEFPLLLSGNNLQLEPILQQLVKHGFVAVINERYVLAEKGREELVAFQSGYTDFLKELEVYQAVDLTAGEFAWSAYFDFDDEEEFQRFLNDERWEDVRFAVLEYKNQKKFFKRNRLKGEEIVFMSFLNENRFDFTETGWQEKLLAGRIWDEILDICNGMLQCQDLGGEDVIEDIIDQGERLTEELS